jgi:hypothetical protein
MASNAHIFCSEIENPGARNEYIGSPITASSNSFAFKVSALNHALSNLKDNSC